MVVVVAGMMGVEAVLVWLSKKNICMLLLLLASSSRRAIDVLSAAVKPASFGQLGDVRGDGVSKRDAALAISTFLQCAMTRA